MESLNLVNITKKEVKPKNRPAVLVGYKQPVSDYERAKNRLKNEENFLFKLSIGSDNTTSLINDEYFKTVLKIASEYFEGFSYNRNNGFYKGKSEESINIDVCDSVDNVKGFISQIKSELKQESVYVVKFNNSVGRCL